MAFRARQSCRIRQVRVAPRRRWHRGTDRAAPEPCRELMATADGEPLAQFGVRPVAVATVGSAQIIAAQGSVVDFAGCAIVNAANEGCLGGGGVDGAISRAGGEALYTARKALPIVSGHRIRCRTGDAVTTVAGDLACVWVIHAVGPNYNMFEDEDEGDYALYMAYHASMREARAKVMPNLAFSLISAGIFRAGRSLDAVLKIGVLAISAVRYDGLQSAFLVGFTAPEMDALAAAIHELLIADDSAEAMQAFLSSLSPRVQEAHRRALVEAGCNPQQIGVGVSMAAMAATAAHIAPAASDEAMDEND